MDKENKEISMTLKHDYVSKLDGNKYPSTAKYVRRKRESDKHFRKRMRKTIVRLKADIVEHEVMG